jgi:tight adherence protein C
MTVYDLLIPASVFVAIVAVGGAVLTARTAARSALRRRLQEPPPPPSQGIVNDPPDRRPASRLQEVLSAFGRLVSAGHPSRNLQEQMLRAGLHDRSAVPVYLGAKLVLFIIGCILGVVLLLPLDMALVYKGLSMMSVAGLMFFIPNLAVEQRRRKRCRQTRHHLPDVIDLLEICVSSGMSLDAAWNFVADEIRTIAPVLGDEMALTNLEMHLGASRETAMRHMAARTDAEELTALVAVLTQSQRFGTSIAEALRAFATLMRDERSFIAQESAEKVAVKLLFPLVLFIFPAVLVILAGPAAIRVAMMMGYL